jgi:hypothetical protein
MCFHIGPEFVEALRSKPADKTTMDTPAESSDDTHANSEKEHLTPFRYIVSLFRSIFLTVITVKWILFIVWACL